MFKLNLHNQRAVIEKEIVILLSYFLKQCLESEDR